MQVSQVLLITATIPMSVGTLHSAELTAPELFKRAEVLLAERRYVEAEPLYMKLLAMEERAFGFDRPELLPALNGLAELHIRQGHPHAAEPICRRALEVGEKTLNPRDPRIGYSLNNLAEVYRSTYRYTSAEPLYRRALALLKAALEPEHPYVGRVLNNLASLRVATQHYDEALTLFREALEISEKNGGESSQTAAILLNIAVCQTERGKFREAEPYLLRSLRIGEASPSEDNPPVLRLLETHALVLRKTRRVSQAKSLEARIALLRQSGSLQ